MKLRCRIAVVSLLLFLSCAAFSDSDGAIALTSEQKTVSINQSADYIIVDRALPISEISSAAFTDQWQTYNGKGNFRGAKDSEIWLRFTVQQAELSEHQWWMVLSWSMLEHTQLFALNHDTQKWWRSRPMGSNYPLDNRYIKHRYFIFPYLFEDNSPRTLYLNIRSTNLLTVPVNFWRSDDFIDRSQIDIIVLGAFFGSLLIMLMYNLSVYIILKDKAYLYYCVYVASVIVYQAATSGLGIYYIWDHILWLKKYAFLFTSIFTFISATLFIRHFLKLRTIGGWLLIGNNFVLIMWGLIAVVFLVTQHRIIIPATSLASFITCIVALVTALTLWNRDFPAAKIFTISWGILIAATIVFIFALQGVLPLNDFTRYSQMFGFVVELVLLSVALAYRINYEIDEREQAQSDALMLTKKVSEERRERLKAQMETLSVQRQLNEELESHVVERTEQLNDAMVKLETANAELTKLSVTDPLTKVHNRRFFDDTLINEYKRALRAQTVLAIIVVDIDHFKNINDNYGHTVGDQCLSLVANALESVINRPGDLVARYGGEEFVYMLPGSTEDDALVVANNSREAVEALELQIQHKTIHLSISAGVAAWVPNEEGAYKQLINAADTALYRAKNSGRNCVKTASERGKLAQL